MRPLFLNKKGQSIVEISLITPLLLVALYVPADFGIAFFTAHLTQNAVREAARIAAISPECGTTVPCVTTVTETSCPGTNPIVKEACKRLPARLTTPLSIKITLSGNLGDTCMRLVKVEASGKYNYFLYQLIRLIGGTASNDTPITRAAELRYELQPVTYNTPC
jgi:Flp pilus assembly protein TadG